MRPLEALFVLLSLCVAVCFLIGRWRQIGRFFVAGAILAVVAHGFLEGMHWQMLPAYAALVVLCLFGWKSSPRRQWPRIVAAWSALALTAASVVLSFVLPMFRLPKPTGPYPVGTTILYLTDTSRIEDAAPVAGLPREIAVQLWYPAGPSSNRFAPYREPRETNLFSSYESVIHTNSRLDAPVADATAPFPVILFNHGWGGRRTYDTFLTEELASHGYFVASIDHTYNARQVAFPDGRVVRTNAADDVGNPGGSTPERVRAVWDKELLKQTADERFVLDRLQAMNLARGTPWFGHLDTQTTGAIGHSFGGAASTNFCAEDPRVKASVNMDGWFFGAIRARGPNQPLLFIENSLALQAPIPGPNAPVETVLDWTDGVDLDASLRRYGGLVLTLNGANHGDLTDEPELSPLRALSHRGAISTVEVEKIVRTYVVAFFDKTLRGKDSPILNPDSRPFPEAYLQSWPAGGGGSASPANPAGR